MTSIGLTRILLVVLITAAMACGGGAGETDEEANSRTSTGNGAAAAAALTVDGETYEFDRVLCAVGAEETGEESTEFVLSARQDGMQLEAMISTRFGHVVSLDDIRDHENPSVAWSAGEMSLGEAGSDEFIRVDGKRVSVDDVTFTDETTGNTAPGTLDATCP
ncbi:MAG: hypothetical protein ACODAA_00320 [Gemmatimonadota bacterium]